MDNVRLYDFKKNEKFSIENIRHLMLMSEEFCKTSNMQIGYEVKNDNIKMTVVRSEQTTYGEFIEAISKENVVVEYKVNPLVENLTLFIDKEAVLIIVDLLLGGNGKIESLDRELTNIDLELFRYLIDNLIRRIYIPYEFESIEIERIYTNKVKYQKLNNKDIIFKSLISIALENNNIGDIRLCIPYKSMESVLNDLVNINIKGIDRLIENNDEDIFSGEVFEFIKGVDMDICAKLGTAKVRISDLINLETGDVILLDQKINDDIIIDIGGAEVYKAKPGLLGTIKAIEITDIIDKER